LLPKYVE